MNEEQIKKIALEVAQDTYLKSDVFCCYKTDEAVARFAIKFLDAIDAERGKEAVDAVLLEDTVEGRHPAYGVGLFATLNCVRQVYRYQQTVIPAGYALVPIEPTEEMITAGITGFKQHDYLRIDEIYRAMLAAAKEPHHD